MSVMEEMLQEVLGGISELSVRIVDWEARFALIDQSQENDPEISLMWSERDGLQDEYLVLLRSLNAVLFETPDEIRDRQEVPNLAWESAKKWPPVKPGHFRIGDLVRLHGTVANEQIHLERRRRAIEARGLAVDARVDEIRKRDVTS